MHGRRFDYAILALGVAVVSTAALLIREAAAPALVIAAYRLCFASAPLLLFAAARKRPLASTRAKAALTALAGVLLALHFVFWVSSVQQTSVATSVFLVTAAPLFVAVASGPLLGERTPPRAWLGIAIAAAGAAIMVGDDLGAGGDTLRGDLFAVLGALFAAAYFLVTRRVQTNESNWLSYVTLAYSVAAVVLVFGVAASGDGFFGYSGRTYLFFVLLALGPQLVGHTAVNRSLGYLPAVAVSIAVLGEPVGATLLAWAFLDEAPSALELAGGACLLCGVFFGLGGARDETNVAPLADATL
ncbi:MAG TPA: DMT family transporter [Dehalococcoidia bacterium]|nr:DMT family transporter [Dehalococcoidia bacterium]